MEISSLLQNISIRNCGRAQHTYFDFILIFFSWPSLLQGWCAWPTDRIPAGIFQKKNTFLQEWSVYLPLTCFWNRFFTFFFFLIHKPALTQEALCLADRTHHKSDFLTWPPKQHHWLKAEAETCVELVLYGTTSFGCWQAPHHGPGWRS